MMGSQISLFYCSQNLLALREASSSGQGYDMTKERCPEDTHLPTQWQTHGKLTTEQDKTIHGSSTVAALMDITLLLSQRAEHYYEINKYDEKIKLKNKSEQHQSQCGTVIAADAVPIFWQEVLPAEQPFSAVYGFQW